MAKYRIAWLPGDGVGKEGHGSRPPVLDALKVARNTFTANIGWEFWITKAMPCPIARSNYWARRTALSSAPSLQNPRKKAAKELRPDCRQGPELFQPHCHAAAETDLHTNVRPCKGYKATVEL